MKTVVLTLLSHTMEAVVLTLLSQPTRCNVAICKSWWAHKEISSDLKCHFTDYATPIGKDTKPLQLFEIATDFTPTLATV